MAKRDHGVPTSSWWGTSVPTTQVSMAAAAYVGGVFQFLVPGRINGFRFYSTSTFRVHRLAVLYTHLGILKATYAFLDQPWSFGTWAQCWLRPWFRVDTTEPYRIVILASGQYSSTPGALSSPVTHNNIQYQGTFITTAIQPVQAVFSFNTDAYGVDVLFQPD